MLTWCMRNAKRYAKAIKQKGKGIRLDQLLVTIKRMSNGFRSRQISQMRGAEQYFSAVLFILLYKLVPTLECVLDKIVQFAYSIRIDLICQSVDKVHL